MFKLSDFGVTRNVATLSNGLRVATFERAGMPLYIEALFFAGSRFDAAGKEGTAHFSEHLIAAETKKFPKIQDLWSYVERRGGVMNAHTGYDTMGLLATFGDPADISVAAEVLSEEINNPLFRSEKIASERQTILKEIGMTESKPDRYLGVLWNSLLYSTQEYGRPVLGTTETLKNVTDQDLRDFHQKFIARGAGVLVVSGDISIERVVDEFEKNLKDRKFSSVHEPKEIKSPREKSMATKKFGGSDQVYFMFGFKAASEFEKDSLILDVLGGIAAGGFNSILYEKLRHETGLVYSIGAGSSSFVDRGAWLVNSSTSKDKLGEALKILTDEIGKIHSGQITQEQLDFVKDHELKSARLRTQTASSWASMHIYSELFRPDGSFTFDKMLNEIDEISLDDVKRVAKEYLLPGQWYFAATGDVEESDIKIDY